MKELLVYRFEEVIYAPIYIVFPYVDDDEKIKQWKTVLKIFMNQKMINALQKSLTLL